ncbi:MAG: hypothetical protein ACRDHX_14790 [Chloroflexota bacterium]
MLTSEQTELMTRVGPATPRGALLREYRRPALLPNEQMANQGQVGLPRHLERRPNAGRAQRAW